METEALETGTNHLGGILCCKAAEPAGCRSAEAIPAPRRPPLQNAMFFGSPRWIAPTEETEIRHAHSLK